MEQGSLQGIPQRNPDPRRLMVYIIPYAYLEEKEDGK